MRTCEVSFLVSLAIPCFMCARTFVCVRLFAQRMCARVLVGIRMCASISTCICLCVPTWVHVYIRIYELYVCVVSANLFEIIYVCICARIRGYVVGFSLV